jgi:toxin ParE1/3/4
VPTFWTTSPRTIDNPPAAVRMDELFSEAADRLGDFPMLGHVGRVLGTRELIPHESYRLVYEFEADTVWILALVHTARQWPPVRD